MRKGAIGIPGSDGTVLGVMCWGFCGPVLPLQGGLHCPRGVPLPGTATCPGHTGPAACLRWKPVIAIVCSRPFGLPCKGKM